MGDDAVDVRGSRALLAAHDYDDCAELAEWLEIERQRMLRHHLARLHDEAEGLEATGDARAALQAYERIVALEPADEAARCFEVVGAASDAFTAAEATVTLRFVAGAGALGDVVGGREQPGTGTAGARTAGGG